MSSPGRTTWLLGTAVPYGLSEVVHGTPRDPAQVGLLDHCHGRLLRRAPETRGGRTFSATSGFEARRSRRGSADPARDSRCAAPDVRRSPRHNRRPSWRRPPALFVVRRRGRSFRAASPHLLSSLRFATGPVMALVIGASLDSICLGSPTQPGNSVTAPAAPPPVTCPPRRGAPLERRPLNYRTARAGEPIAGEKPRGRERDLVLSCYRMTRILPARRKRS